MDDGVRIFGPLDRKKNGYGREEKEKRESTADIRGPLLVALLVLIEL
jgi:hypothetical protein